MTDRDGPTGPDHPAVPDEETPSSDTASFAPLRGRPVLPRALDTRPIDGDEQAVESASPESAAPDSAVPAGTSSTDPDPDHDPDPSPDASAAAAGATDTGETDVDASDVVAPGAGAIDSDGGPTDSDPDSGPTDAVPIEADDDPDEPSSLEAPAALDEPVTPRRRFGGKGAIAIGGRAAVGVVGLLVAAATIVGVTALPAPLLSIEPPQTVVSPVAAAQQRVCPGPLLRLGDDRGQGASVATSVGRAASVYRATPRAPEADDLAETENTAGVAPQLLTLPPGPESAGVPTALAGSQSQAVDSGDLVGLASAECVEASGDTWLVGGSTDVGRTTLITISNPTTVLATVDLAVFGTAGEVSAPGTEGIVVPAGEQRIFSLAGFAPQLLSPVVRVVSRGGLVVANLQQTTVRTLDPGGVEIVGATHAPARQLRIPGLLISGSDAITDAQGELGTADLQTTLRMFAPGEEDTTASVTIAPARGNDGPDVGDSVAIEGAEPGVAPGSATFDLEIEGGQVTEVPVPGLSDGEYSVAIDSEAPIVAGARVSTLTSTGATDFAWLPAGTGLNDTTLVSIAPGPSPILRMLNPTDESRAVTVTVGDTETTVELEAGEAVPTTVEAGEDATLQNAEGIIATVTYTGAGRLSAFGVTAPGPAASDITVFR